MQESCGNISQEPILPCKKILKIWRNSILSGIDDDARAAMWQAAVDGQPQ